VITNDGRNIVGVLRGFDATNNLILDECHERVYSTKVRVQALRARDGWQRCGARNAPRHACLGFGARACARCHALF
jgi:small nuclear ribonucleoprotein (snRNP)-like protein